MILQTNLTRVDLGHFLAMLTPLTIRLSDPADPLRELVVAPPDSIELVPGRGLRLVTTLLLSWTLAGVDVPIRASSAQLLFLPALAVKDGREELIFSLLLEAIDLRHVPGFLDTTILERINKAFAEDDATISWDFLKTLSFRFQMPARVSSVSGITLAAVGGTVKVTEEEIQLTATFETAVLHPDPPPSLP